MWKYLISPVTLKERVGQVYETMYECRITLEGAVEKMVRRLGENRLPALDDAAQTAVLSLNADWFCSRASFFLLGVYAPPHSRIIQCDSFFGLFPLFDRHVFCFRLMVPDKTSSRTAGMFQVRNCAPAYSPPPLSALLFRAQHGSIRATLCKRNHCD